MDSMSQDGLFAHAVGFLAGTILTHPRKILESPDIFRHFVETIKSEMEFQTLIKQCIYKAHTELDGIKENLSQKELRVLVFWGRYIKI